LQRVVTRRPGFLWDARISMLPGVTVRVVDSYIAGRGLLHAAVQGLFSMAALQGDGEIARGELMRWFAEAAWYPTALLPSQGTQWQAVDDRSALATATDGPIRLTLLFSFDDAGLISAFRAEARGAMVGQQMVMAPWEGIWSNYQAHDGVLVPCTGEVAWMRDGARRPYFVGTVTALKFACSPCPPRAVGGVARRAGPPRCARCARRHVRRRTDGLHAMPYNEPDSTSAINALMAHSQRFRP
jgi:hypothetical protein